MEYSGEYKIIGIMSQGSYQKFNITMKGGMIFPPTLFQPLFAFQLFLSKKNNLFS